MNDIMKTIKDLTTINKLTIKFKTYETTLKDYVQFAKALFYQPYFELYSEITIFF
jgi:hypothetical protein